MSAQAPYQRSLGKILWDLRTSFYKSSVGKISVRDSWQALCTILGDQHEHRATRRAIWHAQSAKRVARAISKFAPRLNESDPARPKWREGCVSDPKMSTAPERERPDPHKVTRGLRERFQNSHRASTRAIRHAQSDETVAWAIPKWAPRQNESDLTRTKWREGDASDLKIRTRPQWERPDTPKVTRGLREQMLDVNKTARAPRIMNIETVKNIQKRCFTWSQRLFLSRSKKYGACHEKWAWGIQSAAPATCNPHHVQNQIRR